MNISLVLQTYKLWTLTKTPLMPNTEMVFELVWLHILCSGPFFIAVAGKSSGVCAPSVSINPSLNWQTSICLHLWQYFCWCTNFHFKYFSQKSSISSACYYVFIREEFWTFETCSSWLHSFKRINIRRIGSPWILKLLRRFHEFWLKTNSWNSPG